MSGPAPLISRSSEQPPPGGGSAGPLDVGGAGTAGATVFLVGPGGITMTGAEAAGVPVKAGAAGLARGGSPVCGSAGLGAAAGLSGGGFGPATDDRAGAVTG